MVAGTLHGTKRTVKYEYRDMAVIDSGLVRDDASTGKKPKQWPVFVYPYHAVRGITDFVCELAEQS